VSELISFILDQWMKVAWFYFR